MKVLKILGIILLVYVGIVFAFESLIGYFQPADASTLVIVTTDDDGGTHERVVSRMENEGSIYVSANHWPRAWYHRAVAHPEVTAVIDGEPGEYVAVAPDEAECARVEAANPHPFAFRLLTGFPPRLFLRLDPVGSGDEETRTDDT
jgi:hypothetical protein